MAMNRNEFIDILRKKLYENNVSDVEEIIAEYDEHFSFKLSDGYSEEEIAAKLGNPEEIAMQYLAGNHERKSGAKKAIVVTGLVFADIFAGAFFVLLFGWILVMSAFTIATAIIGMCYIGGFNVYSLIPPVPHYWLGIIYALMFFSLAVLSGVGIFYCVSFCWQLVRAYGRFHRNCISSASGKAVLPPLPTYPQFPMKTQRILRRIALISLAVFAVTFVLAYISSALAAGVLEFWHAWKWFMN